MISDMRVVERLAERVLVLDGAMGTMIQRVNLPARHLAGDADLVTLSRPDLITAIHHAYLAAGADIITTNTFNSTALVPAGNGLGSVVYEVNVAASQLANEACAEWTRRTPGKPRLVAGSIGPTNRAVSPPPADTAPFPAITSDALKDAYKEQVRGLLDGGCDLLLVETVFDVLNAQAALVAIEEIYEQRRETSGDDRRLPLIVSVTVSETGRTWAGQTLDVFWTSVAHARPLSVGVNCGFGVRGIEPHLAALARIADCAISCHPSAGLPDAYGRYAEQPASFAGALAELATRGLVNIVGGCCGTTPDHIKALAAAVDGLPPRTFSHRDQPPGGVF